MQEFNSIQRKYLLMVYIFQNFKRYIHADDMSILYWDVVFTTQKEDVLDGILPQITT